ncbi:hypothetical protein NDA17_002323 [Ustilago hordei]|nr:hypothetical protein NDA17_002323 [Ustilago hordei]
MYKETVATISQLSFSALTTTLSIQQLAIENNPTSRVDPRQASARVAGSDDQNETPRDDEKDEKDANSTSAKVATRPRRCHGPGCSRSRRVMGSYGRSTGIEDLVDTSREHGRSAVSMETMDSYGLTCKGEPSHMRGGPGTATRRTKLKEQAQPRRGPSSDGYHSGARETRVLGHWQAGPEEEEQCRRSRHQVMRRRSSVEGVDTTQEAQGCQAGEAPEQYSMKRVLSGERAGAASLAML